MHVGKPRTENGKPPIEDQFRELAEMYRAEVRRCNYSYSWFKGIFPKWGRQSPKMCCWLARECFDEMYLHYQEGTTVKQDQRKQGTEGKQNEWGFVNVQLTDDERTAALLDYADPDTLWDTLVVSLKDGYKVTLSCDAETNSYCAALSGTNCGKPNEKLTLTAWGDSETDALKYLLYKHVTRLEFTWQKNGAKERRLG